VLPSCAGAEPRLAARRAAVPAGKPCHLLCGGGGGTMTAVARSFAAATPPEGRRGLVIGVLPGIAADDASWGGREEASPSPTTGASGAPVPPPGYPNRYVELPIYTHLPTSGVAGQEALSRNHINILTSDVVVALPGGPGTASEVRLALHYGKPVVLFLGEDGSIAGLGDTAPVVPRASSMRELVTFVTTWLPGPK